MTATRTKPVTIYDQGAIAVYKGAVRCRILEVKETLFSQKIKFVLVNFGGGVPFAQVNPSDLVILPGEVHITPKRAE